MENKNLHNIEDGILAKFLAGETDDSEKETVMEWIEQTPENKLIFEEFQGIWLAAPEIKNELPVNTQVAWDKLKTKIGSTQPEAKTITLASKNYTNLFLRIAAGFLILLGAGYGIYQFSENPVDMIVFSTQETPSEVVLPDGSKAFLNKYGELKYPSQFKGKVREVLLSGEAFFEVHRDEESPFIIHAGATDIRVLGTSFNVKMDSLTQKTEISVKTGKVMVSDKKDTLIIVKNEKATVGLPTFSIKKDIISDENFLFYKTQKLVFNHQLLKDVIIELNKEYKTQLFLGNPSLEKCPVSVTFENMTTEEAIHAIAENLKLNIIRKDEKIILDGKSCQ